MIFILTENFGHFSAWEPFDIAGKTRLLLEVSSTLAVLAFGLPSFLAVNHVQRIFALPTKWEKERL